MFNPAIVGAPTVIDVIRPRLEDAIPQNCGSPRMNLIQQFEDVAQFGGMIDDVRQLGLSTSQSASRSVVADLGLGQ